MNYYNNNDNCFLFPFLVGAVTGGAAIGLTRPRPIVSMPVNYGPMPYGPYNPGYSYGYNYYYRPY